MKICPETPRPPPGTSTTTCPNLSVQLPPVTQTILQDNPRTASQHGRKNELYPLHRVLKPPSNHSSLLFQPYHMLRIHHRTWKNSFKSQFRCSRKKRGSSKQAHPIQDHFFRDRQEEAHYIRCRKRPRTLLQSRADQIRHTWSDLKPHISSVSDAENKLKAVGLAGL